MYTLSLLLLSVFSLYIGVFAFVKWDASWLQNLNTLPMQTLIILVVCVFLCAGLLLIYRLLKQQSEQTLKRLSVLCIFLIAAGQLAFLFLLEPMLRYDPLKTFDMAVEMLETQTISGTYETGYFSRYTNNYPITILTYWFFKALSGLGVAQSSFMLAVQLVNVACISLSVWLGYLLMKELKNRQLAVFYLIICVLCPLSYVWAGFYYTTTLSMPCMMALLYLYLKLSKASSSLQRLLLGGLFGILLILGYKLRATAMIAFIAVVIAAALNLWKLRKNNWQNVVKKYTGSVAALLLTAALSLSFWSSAVDRYVAFDYKNTGFPMIHWVAMSARWDGEFDQNDELYTSSFETKAEKTEANKQVLIERIKEAGPTGLIALAGRKLLNTWVDGTDGYIPENNFASYGKIYDLTVGNESGFLTIYSQAFRALQMLAVGLSALSGIVTLFRQKKAPSVFLFQLTFLGGMAFHLIWETNPLYSIGFTFLGLMLLADAIANLSECQACVPVLEKSWLHCAGVFVVLLVLLVLGKKELVETPMEKWNYSVNQYQYAGGYNGFVDSYEKTFAQTFTTDKPFNRISVYCINSVGEYNQSAFTVKLTREDGTVVYEEPRFISGRVQKLKSYEFELDRIVPDGPTTYTLEIAPGYIHGEDSLEFLTYNTENYDMYPDGTLTVAGEELKKGDLVFAVYEYEVTTYFSMKMYLVLCAGLLLLCGGITALAWKKRQGWI